VILLAALLAALGIGWYVVRSQRAAVQREAVSQIRRLGGWVFYDCRFSPNGSPTGSYPAGPRWIRQSLGVDFLGTADGVILASGRQVEGLPTFEYLPDHGIPVTDEGLTALRALSQLKWLALSGTQITDAGLQHLAHLSELRWLCLTDTNVSDQGLKHLAELTDLQQLWLDRTGVTSAGIEHLSRLTELRLLSLRETQVDDAGLASLADLNQLESLRLQGTACRVRAVLALLEGMHGRDRSEALRIAGYAPDSDDDEILVLDFSHTHLDDDDLTMLEPLVNLQWLYLNGTQVTDDGLTRLGGLKQLSLLHLADTAVTDRGLEALVPLQHLETLHLSNAGVSQEGVDKFRQAMPSRLRVYLDLEQ
jgi:hypothetical protein